MGWFGRVWAIARMTVIEASRRSVFWVLLLFAIWLLYSMTELPGLTPQDRLRVIQAWSGQTITLFTTLVALFTVGFSLPSDFEEKRIYMLVSKPVEKVTLFLGRYLGFTLVLAILLLFMGIASVVYIRIVQWAGGPDFPAPMAKPQIVASEFGHERGNSSQVVSNQVYIDYNRNGVLHWQFEGLRRKDFPEQVTAISMLVLQSSDPEDKIRFTGEVMFLASSPSGTWETGFFAQTNEELSLEFPSNIISEDGALKISLKCANPDGRIRAGRESVVLFGRSGSFELNFLRGLVLTLLQSMLIMTITLSASTFLSAPTSILMGLMLYLVGIAHGWITEGIQDIRATVALHEQSPHRHRSPDELPDWIMKPSGAISEKVLRAIPDFDRFDFTSWMLKDRAIPWSVLVQRSGYALMPMSIMALIGMLIIHTRALG